MCGKGISPTLESFANARQMEVQRENNENNVEGFVAFLNDRILAKTGKTS